ncbi:hypothetical protein B0H17DRAFT_560002 [Mycena rosella]|uniref:Uncharacterized protein n=1 Tax=Mycena rosella TaxID=1033263 RepID=A0AAD7BPH0_MYCRO|nr:hypothetical protein B0H17DRAFT_560002 [Mycena rosella]
MIRHAVELETGYQNICPAAPAGYAAPKFHVTSSQALAQAPKPRPPPPSLTTYPIVPVPLPSPPSIPPFPPPSIAGADLETYVKPLIMNGWMLSPVGTKMAGADSPLKGRPSLNRVYKFLDFSSAHDFFPRRDRCDPAPRPNSSRSSAGIRVRSSPTSPTVQLNLISELAEDALQTHKYGILYAELCVAIEVEAEFMKNWAVKAENIGFPRTTPATMGQVWDCGHAQRPSS